LYDQADASSYAYGSSDDDLVSEVITILNELDDIDEVGAMSPDSYHAPDADVEAANTDSFFENSSQKGTMSGDDDDVVKPKGKLIALHYKPSNMVYAFDVKTGGEYCGFIIEANFFERSSKFSYFLSILPVYGI